MRMWARIACAVLAALAVSAFVVACGDDGDGGGASTSAGTTAEGTGGAGREGGTITVLMGTAPDYLDPQLAYTTQAVEGHWISYTGLLTYARAEGEAGTRLLPGLADARSIQPTNNQNFSKVDDPFIQRQLLRLNAVPASRLDTVADDWRALDEYTARRAYNAVFGSISVPKFFSDRLDFQDAIFHPLYFNDWSSISLR